MVVVSPEEREKEEEGKDRGRRERKLGYQWWCMAGWRWVCVKRKKENGGDEAGSGEGANGADMCRQGRRWCRRAQARRCGG